MVYSGKILIIHSCRLVICPKILGVLDDWMKAGVVSKKRVVITNSIGKITVTPMHALKVIQRAMERTMLGISLMDKFTSYILLSGDLDLLGIGKSMNLRVNVD